MLFFFYFFSVYAERVISERLLRKGSLPFLRKGLYDLLTKKVTLIPRSNISSNSNGSGDDSSGQEKACLTIYAFGPVNFQFGHEETLSLICTLAC